MNEKIGSIKDKKQNEQQNILKLSKMVFLYEINH
jgi:hypothetical protein